MTLEVPFQFRIFYDSKKKVLVYSLLTKLKINSLELEMVSKSVMTSFKTNTTKLMFKIIVTVHNSGGRLF